MTSIQDGSHSSPPVNPIGAALDDLETEVREIQAGFLSRLRSVGRSGQDALQGQDAPAEDPHILPVPEEDLAAGLGASVPIVGRSADEVVAALERAEAFAESHSSAGSESSSEHTEGVSAEAKDDPASPAHHVEL